VVAESEKRAEELARVAAKEGKASAIVDLVATGVKAFDRLSAGRDEPGKTGHSPPKALGILGIDGGLGAA
jgi:hypothetical protein